MIRFSANVSTLFTERPFLERFSAAARAGFRAVELWFPYMIEARDLADELETNELVCICINSPPGDTEAGDWGLAADSARDREFRESVEQAMSFAQSIACPNVHVMAGNVEPGVSREEAWETYTANIRIACDRAAIYGRTVLIEPLNAIDRPAYLLHRQADALRLVERLRCSNLRILFDAYHVYREEGDVTRRLRQMLPRLGHIQIADAPSRHEPGTGEINFRDLLAEIARMRYSGWVGCEYFPSGRSEDSLRWRSDLL